ncbi:MAG: DnaJ domain-containing protein [Arenimonas sp.]|uniref:DnaJ family molecular chaperone n=1 Tax=Arenimonas sp. TaxID=1872635 RepID=UPI001B5518F1|nr:DnaJ domain-containing protein [Arenimonas sp.]
MKALSQWKGKIIGGLIGLLLRRPVFILLGVVIGHLYDKGAFSGKRKPDTLPTGDTADPYIVLDVAEGADMEAIDAAYRRRMSEYHPDKVANAAPEIKELAERRARDINAAYEEIRKRRQQP